MKINQPKSILKIIVASLIGLLIISCDKIYKQEQEPAYVIIDSIILGDSNAIGTQTHDITDAWVTLNGNYIGVFETPCTIPILTNDSALQNLFIQGGIKVNGMTETRAAYPFYEAYVRSVEINKGDIISVNPTIHYKNDDALSVVVDNQFEGSDLQVDLVDGVQEPRKSFEEAKDGSGSLHLELNRNINATIGVFAPEGNFTFPPNSASPALMMEFDYKCDHQFTAGLLLSSNGQDIENRWIVSFVSTEGEWKKAYVNFTGTMSQVVGVAHRAMFGMELTQELDFANLYIDNLKILSTK